MIVAVEHAAAEIGGERPLQAALTRRRRLLSFGTGLIGSGLTSRGVMGRTVGWMRVAVAAVRVGVAGRTVGR